MDLCFSWFIRRNRTPRFITANWQICTQDRGICFYQNCSRIKQQYHFFFFHIRILWKIIPLGRGPCSLHIQGRRNLQWRACHLRSTRSHGDPVPTQSPSCWAGEPCPTISKISQWEESFAVSPENGITRKFKLTRNLHNNHGFLGSAEDAKKTNYSHA